MISRPTGGQLPAIQATALVAWQHTRRPFTSPAGRATATP
jgi:hypothetical protein